MPEQQWSPQSSGIQIKEQYTEALDILWQHSRGLHTLEMLLLETFNNAPNQSWLDSYRACCQRVTEIRQGSELTDTDLANFWRERFNGVISERGSYLNPDEFEDNISFLRTLTEEIIHTPSPEQFESTIERWQEQGRFKQINWSVIKRIFAMSDPEQYTLLINQGKYLEPFCKELAKRFQIDVDKSDNWCRYNAHLLNTLQPYLSEDWDCYKRNIALWRLFQLFQGKPLAQPVAGHEPAKASTPKPKQSQELPDMATATNTILYGPLGTGKTYHTVEAAVRAADPDFALLKSRESLKARYEELVATNRIRFVTFHQSFSYEEFVEGLRAETSDGQISYEVAPGIFKQICDDARVGVAVTESLLEDALNCFKEKLGEEERIELETLRGNRFGVEFHGNRTFRVFPEETSHEDLGRGYPVSIEHIQNQYRGTNLDRIYNSSYVKAILAHLMEEYKVPAFSEQLTQGTPEHFVLVIDEINRGNISKIFGELITLIEPSKRTGQPEALSVQLPYSQETFSVPSNLHIIGTMNTADRSLAMMDTALRRRFDFKEMMPNPSLLAGVQVKGVDISALLEKMNQRIEYLYDREHTLGHAFFMPLKALQDETELFAELRSIFKNKVIPLLEEYFFEDWEKIRLVLGDNQHKDEALQFVKRVEVNSQSLFGNEYQDDVMDDGNQSFQLNAVAFDNIDAYRKISGSSVIQADASIESE